MFFEVGSIWRLIRFISGTVHARLQAWLTYRDTQMSTHTNTQTDRQTAFDQLNPLKPNCSNCYSLLCDIRALWRSALSATAPECQKLMMVVVVVVVERADQRGIS